MIVISTTPTLEGRPIRDYLGVVTGEVIVGANIFKDLFAGIRDIVGGRAGAYESTLRDARNEAFRELRPKPSGSMLMRWSGSISIMKSSARVARC